MYSSEHTKMKDTFVLLSRHLQAKTIRQHIDNFEKEKK